MENNTERSGITRRSFAKAALLGVAAAGTAVATAGCSGGGKGSGSGSAAAAAFDFGALDAGTLKVGAGCALIKIDKYCPIDEGNTQAGQTAGTPSFVHSEGYYTNVHKGHDLRFNIVLLEFNGEKFAITSIEHVNPVNIDDDKALVEKLTGVAPDHQWYHNPHVLSAPNDINQDAINTAIEEACAAATAGLREARFGYGEGVTYANTNRCYETAEGWSQVSNDNGNTDHILPVRRTASAHLRQPEVRVQAAGQGQAALRRRPQGLHLRSVRREPHLHYRRQHPCVRRRGHHRREARDEHPVAQGHP